MLGASTQRAGLLATPGVASSRQQLRGSKVTAFPIGATNRSKSHHLAHRANNKFTQIKAIAEADKSASSSAGGSNVVIDNSGDKETLIILSGQNRPGKFILCIHPIQPSLTHLSHQLTLIFSNLFFRFVGFSGLYLQ
jgi:hypothetical protein